LSAKYGALGGYESSGEGSEGTDLVLKAL